MGVPKLTADDVRLAISGVEGVQFLASGGQKIVFLCYIEGKPYVIKFIKIKEDTSEDSSLKEDIIARAKREIEIMDKCSSSNLVRLGPIGMNEVKVNEEHLLYFTEEYVEGITLDEFLNIKPLDLKEALTLGLDMTNAIENLWKIGMIHRDIKPQNIIRHTDGHYVLLDAGIAFDLNSESLTSFGPVGTRLYMSPEQLNSPSRKLDFRSDLFLLGIVLYEAISGEHPFYQKGMNISQLLSGIINSTPDQLRKKVDFIPTNLNKIVMRLLSKQPHLRYRNIEMLKTELIKIKGEI